MFCVCIFFLTHLKKSWRHCGLLFLNMLLCIMDGQGNSLNNITMIKIVIIEQWCNCYSLLQYPVQSHVTFNCHVSLVSFHLKQFCSLPWFFLTLMFFMSTGQLLWRICLNLDLSACSWLDSDMHFGHICHGNGNMVVSIHHIQRHLLLVCPTLGGVKFNPWLRWCLSSLPIRKFEFKYLYFVFKYNFWRDTLRWSK